MFGSDKEFWNNRPRTGLVLGLLWSGFWIFWSVHVLFEGEFHRGRGVHAPEVTRNGNPLEFCLGVAFAFAVGTVSAYCFARWYKKRCALNDQESTSRHVS